MGISRVLIRCPVHALRESKVILHEQQTFLAPERIMYASWRFTAIPFVIFFLEEGTRHATYI